MTYLSLIPCYYSVSVIALMSLNRITTKNYFTERSFYVKAHITGILCHLLWSENEKERNGSNRKSFHHFLPTIGAGDGI
jgi:hypothetical protein